MISQSCRDGDLDKENKIQLIPIDNTTRSQRMFRMKMSMGERWDDTHTPSILFVFGIEEFELQWCFIVTRRARSNGRVLADLSVTNVEKTCPCPDVYVSMWTRSMGWRQYTTQRPDRSKCRDRGAFLFVIFCWYLCFNEIRQNNNTFLHS